MRNELKLFTEGTIQDGQGREFTRLMGGFGDDKPCISDKQIADLLNYKMGARQVRQQIERNIKYFNYGQDLLDFKREDDSNTLDETLVLLGYAKQSITQAKNIYILSEAGFLLYLKFAEGDKAVELYKDFLEDYFKTKAENKVMKKTLEEEKEFLIERKKFILGSMFMEQDDIKRMEYFKENEQLSSRIKEIEVVISNKELKKKIEEAVKDDLVIADKFTGSDGLIDVGTFSKVLNIKGLGRNNMFDWFRDQKFLMKNNIPYQQHMNHFKVLQVPNIYTKAIDNKTVIKLSGVKYIINKLIEDGKIIPKSIDEIMEELDNNKVS